MAPILILQNARFISARASVGFLAVGAVEVEVFVGVVVPPEPLNCGPSLPDGAFCWAVDLGH